MTVFIPLATDRTPQLLRDCSVRWLLLHVVTDAPVRQTITHCNGVTSWTVLLFGALRKHSCITCPRDLNAQKKQTSQTQAVILTCFSSVQLISITAIGCSVFSTIWICLGRQSEHLEQHVTFFLGFMHSGCLQFHNSPAFVSTEPMSDIFDRGRQAETSTYTMIKLIYCILIWSLRIIFLCGRGCHRPLTEWLCC